MNDTSLNIIAITLFTLVMTSLLGPLLHIPPSVPAIATVTILGVATLDNFNWGGRGSALLLDWAASFSPQHRERVVRHEAGHFLVAHQLGIPITGYTLTAWDAFRQGQPGLGGVSFDTQRIEEELQTGQLSAQWVDRYCTLWMAGIAAETLIYGEAEGGADDRTVLRSLLSQLRQPGSVIEQKERWAILQAKTLLETHRPGYDALVEAMTRRASVEECEHLLRSTAVEC